MNTKQTEALKLALDLALDVRANANARFAAKAIALTGVIDEALAEQPAQQCWQPIETAPQDGSFVDLLVSPRTGKRRRVIDAWWTELTGWRNDYGALDFGLTPTHWMPPPPEPETQPAQHIDPETRTKDGLKYSPNYVAGYNNGLKAAQQQEPVAWLYPDNLGRKIVKLGAKKPIIARPETAEPLYTSPPASKPLTKEEIIKAQRLVDPEGQDICGWSFTEGVRWAERHRGITGEQK